MKRILLSLILFGMGCNSSSSVQNEPSDVGPNDSQQDVIQNDSQQDSKVDTVVADSNDASWDPVWHLSEPQKLPEIGPEGMPDCGPGCRVALNGRVGVTSYHLHGNSPVGVVNDALVSGSPYGKLLFAPHGSSRSVVLDEVDQRTIYFGEFDMHENLVSYGLTGKESGEVRLANVLTGEKKVVYKFPVNDKSFIRRTGVNDSYVFWFLADQGFMSRNLKTGEVRTLQPDIGFMCNGFGVMKRGPICGDLERGIILIDQDSGEIKPLSKNDALQLDVNIAPDKQKAVWVDYRDPPGQDSDLDFRRSGGEIYLYDSEKNETRRLTFDSPKNPKGKTLPAVGENIVTWYQMPLELNQNPTSANELTQSARDLLVLDLKTNKKCRIEKKSHVIPGAIMIHGRHVYGIWSSNGQFYLIDVNLDDPSVKCIPEE